MTRTSLVLGLVVLAACAPKRVNEAPIMENGDRVGTSEATIAAAGAEAERRRAAGQERMGDDMAAALATCAPDVCAAVTRGEVVLGMNATQVMAATRTTRDAWSMRQAGSATVLMPTRASSPPSDAVGDLALVQLRDGQVVTYSYSEPQGVRVVSRPADATREGRAAAMAEQLIVEGDQYAARGALDEALDRYDRASVLLPGDPSLDYRIATVLDKQLRPIEALLRYRLFLHKLELERIDAVGDAYAKYAAAAAHAKERIIVLEKR